MTTYLWRKNYLKDSRFLIADHGGHREVTQYFANAERKNCLPGLLYPEIYPSKHRGTQDILR